jgi:hypothetical protein
MIEISRAKSKEFGLEIKNNDLIENISLYKLFHSTNIECDSIKINGVFHLISAEQRIELLEWAFRSLIPSGKLVIQVPSWYHGRSYSDPGVQWPPLSAEFFLLSNKGFREANMPHVYINCNFEVNASFAFDSSDVYVSMRNQETQATLLSRNVNTCTEYFITLTKPSNI